MNLMAEDRFDPAKDAVNREKHKLPLAFGDRVFADDSHLIIPRSARSTARSGLRWSVSSGRSCSPAFRLAGRLASLHLGEKEQQG
ncbi:hypothetical protein [Mesorhizobium sp.]|uniref:hypothetical protein n=1 Tax=Mesorhizobium sp. TaxID=1871066 RepID=UPI00257957BB|nr:hypothetical protein [Mesorhizobium sp.]